VHDARTERRRAHRFVRRVVQAAAVLLPEALRREAVPIAMVQPGLSMALHSARPAALRQ
jgi:hypothetical protein